MTAQDPHGVALLTNIPTPYRNPVFERLPRDRFTVLFCASTESNRHWRMGDLPFVHEFLNSSVRPLADGFNHVHDVPGIWGRLERLRPRLLITTGFNPVHLRAFLWSQWRGVPHVAMTDGTRRSESGLSWKHRAVRRIVFARSRAFIAAALDGLALYRSYGIPDEKLFRSHLCADNMKFLEAARPLRDRDIDVLFVGQLHERKMPMFFAEACSALCKRRGALRVGVVGSGPLSSDLQAALRSAGVQFDFPGFVQPDEMPGWFGRARLLFFPTRLDPWGVVANEAMAAGTPVLTTPAAGVAGDLVADGRNGLILAADVELWASAADSLLRDPQTWQRLSCAAQRDVEPFSFDAAAAGIVNACEYASAGVTLAAP
ncbi:MAG: glycosyltransferase [Rubrivivax sp.]|nr:glycosyltransferase [Rubrivivax sp.]